jgi:hypothetical protein
LLVKDTNEFGNHFGIGLTGKDVTLVLQFPPQFIGIVERAIVDQSNATGRIHVRMGIFIRLAPVRGPPRMGNPHGMSGAGGGMGRHEFNAVGIVAGTGVLGHGQWRAGNVRHGGNARTVVTSIFEHGQTFQQKCPVSIHL